MINEKNQRWASALQTLLGYSAYAPVHTAVSHPSTPTSMFETMQHSAAARDVIHAAFENATKGATMVSISLLIRENGDDRWVRNCRLYASSHWSPIQLLSESERWFVGPGGVLASAKLPHANRRAKGEDLAMNRWRRAVEKIVPRASVGAAVVCGEDAVVQAAPDDFDIAA